MKTKWILLTSALLAMAETALACEVCKKQQPEVLRSFSHGAGPQSNWDYVLVLIMVLVSAVSLFLALRYLVRPGERNPEHIKRSILNAE